MRRIFMILIAIAAVNPARAATSEPSADPKIDPAPCAAAAAADDADGIIAVCGVLIDNEKTAKADRI